MKKPAIGALGFAVGLLATGGYGHADTLINTYPTTSTSNIVATASSIEPNTAVNGPNRTVIQDNNGFNPTTGEHNSGTQQSWRSANADSAGLAEQWIQWDLGNSYTLSSIRVWNFNDSFRYAAGIRQVDIYISNTVDPGDPEGAGSGNWTLWAENAILAAAPGSAGYTGFDLETQLGLSLPLSPVRYVRFEVNSTFRSDGINVGGGTGDGENIAALAQIEFYEAGGVVAAEPAITSFSLSGDTATVTMTGDDAVDYWCASSTDLTDWSTEEAALETGTATPIPSPFNTSGGTLTFDVDVTGDSKLFLRIQDADPSP